MSTQASGASGPAGTAGRRPRGRGLRRTTPTGAGPTTQQSVLNGEHKPSGSTIALAVGATGVVFGDIGTSPLYAMKESLNHAGVGQGPDTVLGIASLVFWALTLVVTIKYLTVIMRADNHGEGGVLALLALLPGFLRRTAAGKATIPALLILVGAGLLYGDGALTPAISVLSAVEGVGVVNPALEHLVVPLTCLILFGLFMVQSRGTATLGRVFGPVMICWFALIGGLGLMEVIKEPSVIRALLPSYALATLFGNGIHGFLLLGSIILAVTGAEALYADMGHFGARPIRYAWLGLVKPALVLAYLGQAAMVINDPSKAENPLYALAPNRAWAMVMLALATAATIIASQALISGVYSLTRQAVQLGYFPRVRITHTSGEAEGQIYIPAINYMLMVACITLVLVFRSSASLAAAYGVAVAGTMSITSIAFYGVARYTWKWPVGKAGAIVAGFLVVDLAFLLATLPKFLDGGYVPIGIGAVVVAVMYIWHFGQNLLHSHVGSNILNWVDIHGGIEDGTIIRTPGTGVFLASNPDDVPQSMSSHVQLLHSLPEHARVVTITTASVPVVVEPDRFVIADHGNGIEQVLVRSGFMETPHVPLLMDILAIRGDADYFEGRKLPSMPVLPDDAIYFTSNRTFVGGNKGQMPALLERLFAVLHRNAASPTAYFNLPTERVVTLGTLVDL